ncbi:hypothetical protein SHIRM173S_12284 [Streptomyces hirsutus]
MSNEEVSRWDKAAKATGFTGSAQFLAQEYRHVVLAQGVGTLAEYEAADRRGRGSRLTAAERPLVWETVERFTADLAADGCRTWLQTCAEAARLLEAKGPQYRHVVVDEAQDLHPVQWRLLRAAVPARPDDLFIAGDPHQRIYDSKVSLKSLGIKVTGRSVKLRKNYRSTQEILRWSTALLIGRPISQLEEQRRFADAVENDMSPPRPDTPSAGSGRDHSARRSRSPPRPLWSSAMRGSHESITVQSSGEEPVDRRVPGLAC